MTPAELAPAKAAAAVELEDDLLIAVMGLIPGPTHTPSRQIEHGALGGRRATTLHKDSNWI